MRSFVHALFAAALVQSVVPVAHAAGPTGLLNDTGQTLCYDGAAMVSCTAANTGDAAAYPRQDGRFGRDAKAGAGTLSKIGGGAAGFDFTKVCMSGQLAGQGSCPANPAQGVGANDWACTKDNITNLIWSIETISNTNWTDATTIHPVSYNAASRCGFNTGWRAPARRELLSIVHYGAVNPSIDTAYFPATVAFNYWAAETVVPYPSEAWLVHFFGGGVNMLAKTATFHVRLVRSGQ